MAARLRGITGGEQRSKRAKEVAEMLEIARGGETAARAAAALRRGARAIERAGRLEQRRERLRVKFQTLTHEFLDAAYERHGADYVLAVLRDMAGLRPGEDALKWLARRQRRKQRS